jgi:beta-glucosidase
MTSQPIFNKQSVDKRVEELLSKMTLREKISLLSAKDNWNTVPIDRLGIPSLTMTDGPHGVRSNQPEANRIVGPATSFPTGASMASSWNPELIQKVGAALGEETRAMGCHILLGPCVNIARTPLAGRNFESYSEDPYLAGRIGVAYVKGVQSQAIGTSVKHYACNNQEIERGRGSSNVDERTFREIYLAQFEAIVKEAHPWTVMCSYNRINGDYASQNNHLLNEILKQEWDFEGVVISDWGANHTIVESVKGGLDIEMPGPAKYYGNLLVEAVRNWQIDETVIDASVRRILRMIIISGKMDDSTTLPPGSINTPEHQALACVLAEESITLLKNKNKVLPLRPETIRSVAVIGPNAVDMPISGGGSAFLEPPYRINPLDGIISRLGEKVKLSYEKGCDNFVELPVIKSESLIPSNGSGNGLWGEYYENADFSGKPILARTDAKLDFWWFHFANRDVSPDEFSVRWSGKLTAPESGLYTIKLINTGIGRVYLDGKLILENSSQIFVEDFTFSAISTQVDLDYRHPYDLRVEVIKPKETHFIHLRLLSAPTPRPGADARFERAVELARKSDVAIVFAGLPEGYETEGADRPDLELTGRQNELIKAIASVNRKTIVVLNNGAPVTMPWIENVSAVVEAFYPGMEGGNAIAKVLFGEVNPSGKLSMTYPKKLKDNPAYINYPGTKEVNYGEGIFVGYRYYDKHELQPLFPFGHGLSYTEFEYSDLQIPDKAEIGKPVTVSLTVKNVGGMTGKEVVQLYLHDKESTLPRPPKELKGFQKVLLKPGQSKIVKFRLDQRAFSFYDPYRNQWVAEPGEFEALVGSSSHDIRLRAKFQLT